jgi:hypothetical protein
MAHDLDQLIDMLGQLSASERGLSRSDARAHMAELKGQVETIKRIVEQRVDDEPARRQAADEVDKLIDTVALIEKGAARKATPQLEAAFRDVDVGKISSGLRIFAQWLRAPTPESTAAIERLVEMLRATTPPGWEDQAAAKQLEAEIDANVQRSLDDIFGKPEAPE